MSEFLNRFSFQIDKLTGHQVWMIAVALWIAVVACAASSIVHQPFSRRQRAVWLIFVTFVPILGLLAYLPFSIRRDDLPTAFLGRPTGKDRRRPQRQLTPPRSPRA